MKLYLMILEIILMKRMSLQFDVEILMYLALANVEMKKTVFKP